MELMLGEETEWSASTATLPLDQASPRSVDEEEEDEEEDEEEQKAWAVERRSRKGLRALLLEMDVDDKAVATRRRQRGSGEDAEEEEEEEEEEGGVAAHAELRHAEERVRALETRLLDAEETIYHLKAEKMEAWRRVEKLTRLNSASEGEKIVGHQHHGENRGGGGGEELVVRLRAQVYELEGQLADLKTQHAVELEQQMAVIREQEREIMVLQDPLTDAHDHVEDLETKYEELVDRYEQTQRQLAYEQKEEEDDDPVKMIGSNGVTVDDTSLAVWREEIVRHPTPHFDLDSPEVQYLLTMWTKNAKKLQYLRTWLLHVAIQHDREVPVDFPMGVELPRLAPEIKDGFLTLVVPLLRKQPWREIQVHTRQYNDQFHTDVRIRVVPRRP